MTSRAGAGAAPPTPPVMVSGVAPNPPTLGGGPFGAGATGATGWAGFFLAGAFGMVFPWLGDDENYIPSSFLSCRNSNNLLSLLSFDCFCSFLFLLASLALCDLYHSLAAGVIPP